MYVERFEFFCPECHKKGIVTDVLLNPELMIIRGRCPACDLQSVYKAVDMAALQAEHEVFTELTRREDQSEDKSEINWRVVRFKIKGA